MRPTRPHPFGAAALAAIVLTTLAGAVPVLARDQSVGGTPDVTITLGSVGLSDRDVRIDSGSIVRFVNQDDDRHRVRARSGPAEFDSGNLESGEWFQVRLTAAGTYAYADERDREDGAYQGRIVVGTLAPGGDGSTGGGGAPGGGGGNVGASGGGSTNGGGGATTSSATVTIGDDFFDPGSIRVSIGGTVTFQNTGEDEHSATSTAFDTGVLAGGASATQAFPTAGTFDFLCMFHSDMRGTIEVVGTAPAEPAPAAPSATQVPSVSPTTSATPAAPATDATAPDAVTGPVEVDIVDFAFEAADVVVGAGGTVVWRNSGVAPHTATADDGSWDSGMLATGDTFGQTFETPGRFAYLCAIHPDMTGTVEVIAEAGAPVAAPSAAVAALASSPPGPAAGGETTGSSVQGVEAGSPGTAPASDVSGLAGIVLTVSLVSVAAALFSRAIRGTVRQPE